MSHVVDYAPGSVEQKIRHMACVQAACQNILTATGKQAVRLRLMAGAQIGEDGRLYDTNGKMITKGNAHYRTWIDDHGRLAGDWAVPRGMTADEIGKNAVAVIELTEDGIAELPTKHSVLPYQAGFIPNLDPETGEMTYSLTHDFFHGGYGLEHYLGKTVLNNKKDQRDRVEQAHGDFLQMYQMMAAKLAAQEAGHSIEFHKEEDGSYIAIVDKENQGVTA